MKKKFEYRYLGYFGSSNPEIQGIFLKEVNGLGEEGWEVCVACPPEDKEGYGYVLLKREKEIS